MSALNDLLRPDGMDVKMGKGCTIPNVDYIIMYSLG